jgi:fibronectin-binding autotransporter adhesin
MRTARAAKARFLLPRVLCRGSASGRCVGIHSCIGGFGRGGRWLRAALLASTSLVAIEPAAAQVGTWLASPPSSDFNDGQNWNPGGVPNNAIFGATDRPEVTVTDLLYDVNFTFDATAPAYTVTQSTVLIIFTGAGIVNNSGVTQTFFRDFGFTDFSGFSTAGNVTIAAASGTTHFLDNSSAANATIGGSVSFNNSSTAANATITGSVTFHHDSTAANATITVNSAFFTGNTTAANASITSNLVAFFDNATAGNATIVVPDDVGVLRFDLTSGTLGDNKVSAGSIAGGGTISLGINELTVGGNGNSTTYRGVIEGDGSLVKTGAGRMILSGDNTYLGATTISQGTLQIGDGGLTGSLASSNIVNNSALVFDRDGTVTYGGVISGSGTLEKRGAGTRSCRAPTPTPAGPRSTAAPCRSAPSAARVRSWAPWQSTRSTR